MTTLLGSFDLYGLALPNRVVMAPMTRTRATDDRVPTKLMRDYVFFEGLNGGAVFSAGAICWRGCFSYNNYDNNVSRITENVLRRFEANLPAVDS